MCGIAGYVDFSSGVNPSVLNKITDVIVYRGPDSKGCYISSDNFAALGVRRLRIIDLVTGDQPIKNEDGSVVVVYNGEIYNYKNLKSELVRKGHRFRTKTDTEVIVHAYEQYGEDFTKKLNGMFSFAIWDEKAKKLFLGRDRAGIKPLYYYAIDKQLIFGSEPKVILAHPKYKKKIDRQVLRLYAYLGFVPGDLSMFSGIQKLLPGHTLSFTASRLKIKKYFELTSNKGSKSLNIDRILNKAVKNQLSADVPVGVFLSGGLDSSLIAYYVASFKKLKSFSIGFKEHGFDESGYARFVAKKIGTEHISCEFGPKDVMEIYEKAVGKLDEPQADASFFPTYKVSNLARDYVTVALSGDGGDELFGGYPTHQAHLYAKMLKFLPSSQLLKLLDVIPEAFINLIPTSFKDYSKKRLAGILLKGMEYDEIERHFYWMRTFFIGDNLLFEKPDLSKVTQNIPNLNGFDDHRIGQVIDFYSYLRDDFLVKTDRASMLNSLEVRVPYLDNEVVDWAFSTPDPHLNYLKTKIKMRELLVDKLHEIAKRPKKGFGIPLRSWLRGELKDFAFSILKQKALYEYVDRKKVNRLWIAHQRGYENNSGTLWMLIMLSGWLRSYA